MESKQASFPFQIIEKMLQGLHNAHMIVADLIKSLLMAVPLTIGVLMLALKSVTGRNDCAVAEYLSHGGSSGYDGDSPTIDHVDQGRCFCHVFWDLP